MANNTAIFSWQIIEHVTVLFKKFVCVGGLATCFGSADRVGVQAMQQGLRQGISGQGQCPCRLVSSHGWCPGQPCWVSGQGWHPGCRSDHKINH